MPAFLTVTTATLIATLITTAIAAKKLDDAPNLPLKLSLISFPGTPHVQSIYNERVGGFSLQVQSGSYNFKGLVAPHKDLVLIGCDTWRPYGQAFLVQ